MTLWVSTDTVAFPFFGVTMLLPHLGSWAISSRKSLCTTWQLFTNTLKKKIHQLWLGLSQTPSHIIAFEYRMAGAKPLTPCTYTHILLTASIAHLHSVFARSTSSWRPRTWSRSSPRTHKVFHLPNRTGLELPHVNHQDRTTIFQLFEDHFILQPLHFARATLWINFHLHPRQHWWPLPANVGWILTWLHRHNSFLQHHRIYASPCLTHLPTPRLDRHGRHDHRLHPLHLLDTIQSNMATLDALLTFLQWNNGNQTPNSTTPTRWMDWTFRPKSAKVASPATKILKGWILCRCLFGSSYTKASKTLGWDASHTAGKPSSFRLTTLARQYLLLSWCHSYDRAMWTWTNWRLTSLAPPDTVSTRKKPHKTWPRKSLNYFNHGFPRTLRLIKQVNNASWNWRRSWPKWNRKGQTLHPTRRHLHHHRRRRLDELSTAKLLPQLLSTQLPSWYHLDQLTLGLWTTNLIRWRRPNTNDGWKIWNSLNTNLTRWPSSWKKSKNGGTNNLTRHPKQSSEPV